MGRTRVTMEQKRVIQIGCRQWFIRIIRWRRALFGRHRQHMVDVATRSGDRDTA